jgi:hypothetical protein
MHAAVESPDQRMCRQDLTHQLYLWFLYVS